jgi:hypothetical protein
MALTDAQKDQIVFFLGWPSKTLVEGSTHYNTTVADRLIGLSAQTETTVGALITSIQTCRTKYEASSSRMLVKRVGDIELNTDEHRSLSKEYRRQVRELSSILDIPWIGGAGVNVGVIV